MFNRLFFQAMALFSLSTLQCSVESDLMALYPTKNKLLCATLQVDSQEFIEAFEHNHEKQWAAWELKRLVIEDVMVASGFFVNHDDGDILLLQWLSGILLRSSSPEEACSLWRALLISKNINPSLFASKYQRYLRLNTEQIEDLFARTQNLLSDVKKKLIPSVCKKIQEKSIYDDYKQIEKTRTLHSVLAKGLDFSLDPFAVRELALQKKLSPKAPLLDRFKNRRILTVSGLKNSKVSFMIHDLFDHVWCSRFLSEQSSMMLRYQRLFESVGTPLERDIFSREGELIASIAFEFRLYLASNDYVPLYDNNFVKKILDESQEKGSFSQSQEYALQLLESTNLPEGFYRSLPFIFSGVVMELMEQRRSYGFVKIVENCDKKELSALDPEYTAFIVELTALFWKNFSQVHSFLVNAALCCENQLRLSVDGAPILFNVRLAEIENLDRTKLGLKKETIEWFERNPGFAATRAILSAQNDEKKDDMKTEFEAKFFVSIDDFKNELIKHGARRIKSETLMRRKTFFLPEIDADSRKNMWGRVRDEGNKITMTIKKISSGESIDGVQEVEVSVDDFDQACAFMKIAGCTEKAYQENFRETWEFDGCQITIDRWPGLKPFVEIEGLSEQIVLNVLQKFGVEPSAIFFGSIDLVYERELGISSKTFNLLPNVTFASIKNLIEQYGRP